jgi:hypothetical protein
LFRAVMLVHGIKGNEKQNYTARTTIPDRVGQRLRL